MMEVLRLGEFAEVSAGNSAPQNDALFKGGTLPFVRTSDVGAIHIGTIQSSRDLLTPEGAKGLKLFPAGTILFPKSGASTFLNHRVILNTSAYVSNHLATIKAKNDVALDSYIFYFLQTIDARDLCQDQSYPSLNRDQVAGIEVPLPPLDEQQRIVEKLDRAFAEIDLLEENLSLMDEKTDQLLQALLSAAFTSIEIREELSESVANQGVARINKALSEFDRVFSVIPDSQTKVKSSSYLESGKYAVVDQGKALIAGFTDSNPTVNEELLPVIVFGDHTRAVKYIDFPFAAGADGTQILKTSPLTEPKYAFYLVLMAVSKIPSKGYARHFGDLKKMLFPIPPLGEQQAIVEKLDSAFAEIELLKRQIKIKHTQATALRQSLLGSVFTQEKATV